MIQESTGRFAALLLLDLFIGFVVWAVAVLTYLKESAARAVEKLYRQLTDAYHEQPSDQEKTGRLRARIRGKAGETSKSTDPGRHVTDPSVGV